MPNKKIGNVSINGEKQTIYKISSDSMDYKFIACGKSGKTKQSINIRIDIEVINELMLNYANNFPHSYIWNMTSTIVREKGNCL